MSKKSYLDIMMGSFGVCVYWHDGAQVNSRMFDFYDESSRPTSKQHLIFRLMRSLRDILAHFKSSDIRAAEVRVVYSGECTFAEPVHTHREYAVQTMITRAVEQSTIQEIMREHADTVNGDYSVCGYILHGISSRGFEYNSDERVMEATFHGLITYCDRTLRVWVDRTLYLAGADVLPIRHRAQSSIIPTVLMEMLLAKSKGSVLVYEFGALQSFSSQWSSEGLQATSIVRLDSEDLLHAVGQVKLIEDICSWCKEPKGSADVVFLMDANYYRILGDELDNVMHKVQHMLPHYKLSAMVYAIDYTNPEDVYRLFHTVYDTAIVDTA